MRPTDRLRDMFISEWTAVARHPFAEALGDGSLPSEKMAWYLVQDHRFIDGFVRLLAQAIAHAPSLEDAVPGAQFIALVTGPENTYFKRSLGALGVPDMGRNEPTAPPTADFQSLMREAAASGKYHHMLAVLVVAEWSYLEWASRLLPLPADLPFYFSEWVDLHSGPGFEGVVAYLRDQLDRAWEGLSEAERAEVEALFGRAVTLEKRFFDAAFGA